MGTDLRLRLFSEAPSGEFFFLLQALGSAPRLPLDLLKGKCPLLKRVNSVPCLISPLPVILGLASLLPPWPHCVLGPPAPSA